MSTQNETVKVPLMDLATVAGQLGLSCTQDVKRLIAKGLLTGRKLANDEWRVTDSALSEYVESGMFDLKPHRYYQMWFDYRFGGLVAGRFLRDVKAILEKGFPKEPPKKATTFKTEPNAALRELMNSPVAGSLDPNDDAHRFKTAAGVYAAGEIQLSARRQLRKIRFASNPLRPKTELDKLFDSTEVFRQVTTEAAAEFAAGSIKVTRKYQRGDRQIPVTIELPHSSFDVKVNDIVLLGF